MIGMFGGCKELEYLDLSNFNTSNVTDMKGMFLECYKLKEIKGINNFNTHNVKTMYVMFHQCKEIKYLDLSSFDTSNVTDMSIMFCMCYKLKEIKGINNFNTINVTKMNNMFEECKELEFLDLSNFNTSKVTDMKAMFIDCFKLKEIKGIEKFNTFNVTDMNGMFEECVELEYLDLSNFNTSNITNMGRMFFKCHKLKQIKGINNFNIKKGTNTSGMFDECNQLEYLVLSKFNISKININENKLKSQLNEEKNKNIKLLNDLYIEKKKVNDILNQAIAINFISVEKSINHPIICFSNDLFSEVEEKLYREYPELRNNNIYFIANGNVMDRTKTLEENNIINATQILINFIE